MLTGERDPTAGSELPLFPVESIALVKEFACEISQNSIQSVYAAALARVGAATSAIGVQAPSLIR